MHNTGTRWKLLGLLFIFSILQFNQVTAQDCTGFTFSVCSVTNSDALVGNGTVKFDGPFLPPNQTFGCFVMDSAGFPHPNSQSLHLVNNGFTSTCDSIANSYTMAGLMPGRWFFIFSNLAVTCTTMVGATVPQAAPACDFHPTLKWKKDATQPGGSDGAAVLKGNKFVFNVSPFSIYPIHSLSRNGGPFVKGPLVYQQFPFTARPGNFQTNDVSNCASTTPPPFNGSSFPDILVCGLTPGNYRIALIAGYDTTCHDTVSFQIGAPDSVATPTVSLASGTYAGNQTVTITTPTSGATIYYTLSGNKPNLAVPNSYTKIYNGPLLISGATTLRTLAAKGGVASAVVARFYTITDPQVVTTPVFTLPGGAYSGLQSIGIVNETPGSSIWFTTNGTVPVPNAPGTQLYTGPIQLPFSATIRAIGSMSGFANSAVAVANYVLTGVQTVAAPTFSPLPGAFPSPQSVTISCATAGATILYTTNGQTPRAGLLDARVYSTPVNISASRTVKARAFLSGSVESPVTVGNYTIGAARKNVAEGELDYYFQPVEGGADLQNEVISVYPNPSQTGVFEFNRTEANSEAQFTVRNVLGQTVISQILQQNEVKATVDLSGQPSGLYFLDLGNGAARKQVKLIKP